MTGYFCGMSKLNKAKRDLYYTNRHDWIDFQGSVAYIGAAMLKVMQASKEFKLQYVDNQGFARKDEIVAHLECDGNTIPVHMPVDGKIVLLNEALLDSNRNSLIKSAESGAWLAKIIPAQPYERKGLLLPKQYQMNVKPRYAKQ